MTKIERSRDLHKAWPEADFHIIPDASHKLSEPQTAEKVIEYMNNL